MLEYAYTTLSVNSNIRLLRLLPAAQTYEDELRVELIEYDVQSCDDRAHPYEALSYCWETLDKPREVLLSGRTLAITENLHAALVQLRHRAFERVLWIDAICIDQSNDREKEIQILMMGEIFAKARSVLVWLGPADERFYDPLGILRDARSQHEDPEMAQGALAQLMSRPWFTRIWIVQEVAVARHVIVMCGSSEMDGHAFAKGISRLDETIFLNCSQSAFSICRLIEGAIDRPRSMLRDHGKLDIGDFSFGGLLSRLLIQKAAKRHDMVYALLGLCNDDFEGSGLLPDYNLPWGILMQRVVRWFMGHEVLVKSWDDSDKAAIKGLGVVVGVVSSIWQDSDQRILEVILRWPDHRQTHHAQWVLQPSSKTIQTGDIICCLKGASMLIVARCTPDYLLVIVPGFIPLQSRTDAPATSFSAPLSAKGAPLARDLPFSRAPSSGKDLVPVISPGDISFLAASKASERVSPSAFAYAPQYQHRLCLVWEWEDDGSYEDEEFWRTVWNKGGFEAERSASESSTQDTVQQWNLNEIADDLLSMSCHPDLESFHQWVSGYRRTENLKQFLIWLPAPYAQS